MQPYPTDETDETKLCMQLYKFVKNNAHRVFHLLITAKKWNEAEKSFCQNDNEQLRVFGGNFHILFCCLIQRQVEYVHQMHLFYDKEKFMQFLSQYDGVLVPSNDLWIAKLNYSRLFSFSMNFRIFFFSKLVHSSKESKKPTETKCQQRSNRFDSWKRSFDHFRLFLKRLFNLTTNYFVIWFQFCVAFFPVAPLNDLEEQNIFQYEWN